MKDEALALSVRLLPFDETNGSVGDLYACDVAVGEAAAPAVKVYWFCFKIILGDVPVLCAAPFHFVFDGFGPLWIMLVQRLVVLEL